MYAQQALLFANEAFYAAFAAARVEAMEALWSEESPVTCIHPGWPILKGREPIMDVWKRLFETGQASLLCRAPEAFVSGDLGYVICYEQLPDALLLVTNIFRRENGQWRMVHHQSGQTPQREAQISDDQPTQQ